MSLAGDMNDAGDEKVRKNASLYRVFVMIIFVFGDKRK